MGLGEPGCEGGPPASSTQPPHEHIPPTMPTGIPPGNFHGFMNNSTFLLSTWSSGMLSAWIPCQPDAGSTHGATSMHVSRRDGCAWPRTSRTTVSALRAGAASLRGSLDADGCMLSCRFNRIPKIYPLVAWHPVPFKFVCSAARTVGGCSRGLGAASPRTWQQAPPSRALSNTIVKM